MSGRILSPKTVFSTPLISVGFFQASINVSATDAFQRQTWLNVSVLPLETTNVDPEQYFSDAKINVFCKEDAPTATHREIVCLWRRTALGAVRVPLAFEVVLDTNHSRASQLALTMDGIDTATLPLLHGSMVYYVEAYTNFVQVEVVDNFSNVKPLNITVLEHDVPWSGIEFVSNDISEMDETTDIILQISPPPGHGEFHLLYRAPRTPAFPSTCRVEYVFVALERQNRSAQPVMLAPWLRSLSKATRTSNSRCRSTTKRRSNRCGAVQPHL